MKLAEWARSFGVHPQTAYRWFWDGRMPLPVRRLPSGTVVVDPPEVVSEGGSGMTWWHPGLVRLLRDPAVTVIVVESRDRLDCFGIEHLEAALAATGRRIVVVEQSETTDDLVLDVVEVLSSMCARLYGRRGTRNRAVRAISATRHDLAEVAG